MGLARASAMEMPDGYPEEKPRRTVPTFFAAPEPPCIGKAWARKTFRERNAIWYAEGSRANPITNILYVVTFLKVALYLGWFYYWVRVPEAPLWGELNAKKFLLYTVLGDVLGFNSTHGVLGFRFRTWVTTWWSFSKVGSLCSPLLPGLPKTRGAHLVLLYWAYLGLLFRALCSPEIGLAQLWPPLLCLAVILPQDLCIFIASRGEHYVYFMVCACFPSDQFLFGCQAVQVMIWFWAGVSKVGPWFKYVVAYMSMNSLLLRPFPKVLKSLHEGPDNCQPSLLAKFLTLKGTLSEIALGPLCVYYPIVGVPLTLAFHTYIVSMVPFASVMEWNAFCMCSTVYHFWLNTCVLPTDLSPVLASFLVLVLVLVPAFGQLFPKLVPFLICYRPYAGNWRFCWHIVHNSAYTKLKSLKSFDSVYCTENAFGSQPDDNLAKQFEFNVSGTNLAYPHFRPLVPIVEELEALNGWGNNDYTHLHQEAFYNQIYGFCLGIGDYTDAGHFDALKNICKLEKRECYVVIFEPLGLLSRTAEWSVYDVADASKPVMSGTIPYKELEAHHPAALPRSALGKKAQ